MNNKSLILTAGLIVGLATACGDRPAPTPADNPGAAAAPAAPVARAAVPESAQFKPTTEVDALQALPASGTCSLENVVNVSDNTPSPGTEPNSFVAARVMPYKLIGFATDSEAGTVPTAVHVYLHGKVASYLLPAQIGLDRPDVAEFFKKPALAKAGYQADAAFDDVTPGIYEVSLIKGEGAARELCATHQLLTVR